MPDMLYDPSTDRYFIGGQWVTVEQALRIQIPAEWPTPIRLAQATLRDAAQSVSYQKS